MKFSINHLFLHALCLVGSTVSVAASGKSRKDVQILMYETDSTMEQDPKSPLHFMKKRSKVANLKTTVYGGDLPFRGFGDKYQTLRPLLEIANPSTLIILTDSRDTVLNVPDDDDIARGVVDYFVESFNILTEKTPNAVVISAEAQCCVSAMTHAHPSEYFDTVTGKRNKRACSSGLPGCRWSENDNVHSWVGFMNQRAFNTTGQEYNGDAYLNAGVMAGYPKDLINLLDAMDIGPTEDDQAVLTGLMYAYPDMIVLDYDQEMFGNNQWTRGPIDGCVFEGNGFESPLIHLETKTQPLIIHAPGKFYGCLDIIIEALGGESQQRYHPDTRKLLTSKQLSGRTSLAAQLGLGGAGGGPTTEDRDAIAEEEGVVVGNTLENYAQYGNYGYGIASNYAQENYGYGVASNYAPENYGYGVASKYAPENYGYGVASKYAPENYGYGVASNYAPENYGYGVASNYAPANYGYGVASENYGYGVADESNYAPGNYGYGVASNYAQENYGSYSSYGQYGSNYGRARRLRRTSLRGA